jgi:hypothetical protein
MNGLSCVPKEFVHTEKAMPIPDHYTPEKTVDENF